MKNTVQILSASSLWMLLALPLASISANQYSYDTEQEGYYKPPANQHGLDLKSVIPTPKEITYMPRFSTGPFYQTGNGDFGLYDLFAPFTLNRRSITFIDGRYIDRGRSREYNLGAGFRHINHRDSFLSTGYVFYDNRRTRFDNTFGQITVGADFQTHNWYFNTNGYIPIGNKQAFVSEFNTAFLCNGNSRICYARGIEKSMGGWDAEVGRTFLRSSIGEFKGYAGMYVFARSGVKTAVGPNLRLQLNLEREKEKRFLWVFDKIALIANWRDDQLVGSTWYAGARFDISIGRRPHLVGLERKMTSFIRRDLNIEVSSDGNGSNATLTEPVQVLTNDFNNQPTVVSLVSNAAGLTAAITAATRADIIGVRGNFTPAAVNQALLSNQIVEGGTYTFTREGATFSVQVGLNGQLTLPAGAAIGDNILEVGTGATVGLNNTIENMTFNMAGAAGVDFVAAIGNDAGFLAVGNLTVQNCVSTDKDLVNVNVANATTPNTLIVRNNTLTQVSATNDTFSDGMIDIVGSTNAGGTTTATISGNTITAPTGNLFTAGARIEGRGTALTVTINNNTITTGSRATNNVAGVMLDGEITGGLVTVAAGGFSGNNITNNSTSADGTALFARGPVTFNGNINNNTLTSTPGTTAGVARFVATNTDTITVTGSFNNNTVTSAAGAAGDIGVFINATGAAGTSAVTMTGGIINNTISNNGAAFAGIQTSPDTNAGNTITITNFFGNTINSTGANANAPISLNGGDNTGTTTVTIGTGTVGGTAGLNAANTLGATSFADTNATINP